MLAAVAVVWTVALAAAVVSPGARWPMLLAVAAGALTVYAERVTNR